LNKKKMEDYMSEHNQTIARPKIEDQIKNTLTGDAKKNALDFVSFVRANGFTSNLIYTSAFDYMTHGVGVVCCFGPNDWCIFWGDDDYFEHEDFPAAEKLKEFAWANVNFCGQCGCPSKPGKRANILGKDFDGVCTSFVFNNPDAEALVHIKKLVLISKLNLTRLMNSYEASMEEREARGKAALLTLEKTPPRGEAVDIDLTTLANENNMKVNYHNGLLKMTTPGDQAKMATGRKFTDTVRIELRAKLTGDEIRLWYIDVLSLFRDGNTFKLLLRDLTNGGKFFGYIDCGIIPDDEFFDIEWIVGREVMAVVINGGLRHACTDYNYIRYYKERPGFTVSSAVSIAAAWGSTVTVESLRVTEI